MVCLQAAAYSAGVRYPSATAVPTIVVVFEVADHHPGLEQRGPVVAVETLVTQPMVERFDEPVFHGVPGGMYDNPTRSA